jgi:glutamine synthetase
MADMARAQNLDVQMGFEVEWAVGKPDTDDKFIAACAGPAYGMGRLVELADYIADLHDALAAQGVEVQQIHPEYATGQFECSLGPGDPVAAADSVVLVRETIRALTNAYGMRPSFAPMLVPGGVGNGGHLHVSLWRDAQNLMSSGDGRYGLTAEGESFLTAVLARLPALVTVGAPTVASYMRLVPSHWAGAYQCWGRENREAAVRLITGSVGDQGRVANAEVKCFDSAANPYLAVGAVLAAGLTGGYAGSALPQEVTVDPAALSDEKRARMGAQRLPEQLSEAIEHFSKAEFLAEAMGPSLFDAFLAVRRAELLLFSGATDSQVIAATRWRY